MVRVKGKRYVLGNDLLIGHFNTVVCSVAWPMNASEAGGDLASIQNFLLFSFRC